MDKNMMAKATYPDETPTPGYLLTDIARLTVANYTASAQLIEFLVARIKKDNHNIKFKCLQLIKHVCRTGRPDFKREMGRNVDVVKECLQYRGPPDPLTGDKMYERVRTAAKEAIEAIFDSQMPVTTSALQQSSHMGGIGGGYVEDAGGSSSSNQNLSSKIMTSVSNTISILRNDTDAQYTGHPGATGAFNGGGGGETYAYNPNSNNSSSNGNNYGGGNSYMSGIGNAPYNPTDNSSESFISRAATKLADTITNLATIDPVTKKSIINDTGDFGYTTNRGSNAYNSNTYTSNTTSSGFVSNAPKTSVWQNASSTVTSSTASSNPIAASTGQYGRAGSAAADGIYERGIIEALCDPSGLKAVPQEDKLQAFLGSVATLSADVVGSCLTEHLNSDAWQSRSKALQVIHSIAKSRNCPQHEDFWREENNAEILIALLSDSKSNVRVNASKVLRTLQIDFNESVAVDGGSKKSNRGPASSGARGGGGGSSNVANLLDDDDLLSASASASASSPVPPLPVQPASSLFQTSDTDLMAGLSAPTPVPASVSAVPVSTSDIFNVFDEIAIDSSNSNTQSQAQSQQQMQPVQQKPLISNVFDFLDSSNEVVTPLPNNSNTNTNTNTNTLVAELSNMTMQMPYPSATNQFQQQQQQQFFLQQQQQQQQFGMLNLSQPYRHAPVGISAQVGGFVGGSMAYPSAMGGLGVDSRKNIPVASQEERTTRLSSDGASGFSFMNSSSSGNVKTGGDSFGFVQDEIKSSKK